MYFKVNNDVHNYNTRQREIFTQIKQILFLGGELLKNSGRLAFNSLPSEIKKASSLAIFKRLLKDILSDFFSFFFPPVILANFT